MYERFFRVLRQKKREAEQAGNDQDVKKYNEIILKQIKQFNKQYNQVVGK